LGYGFGKWVEGWITTNGGHGFGQTCQLKRRLSLLPEIGFRGVRQHHIRSEDNGDNRKGKTLPK